MKSKKETRDTRKGTLCQKVKRDTKVGWLIWINGNAWMAEEWMWNNNNEQNMMKSGNVYGMYFWINENSLRFLTDLKAGGTEICRNCSECTHL